MSDISFPLSAFSLSLQLCCPRLARRQLIAEARGPV
jgi:hypothetical protein